MFCIVQLKKMIDLPDNQNNSDQINLNFVDLKQNDYSFSQLEELNKFNLLNSNSKLMINVMLVN